jgi:hypothetical protein
MFGLIQLFWMFKNYKDITLKIYQLSCNDYQHFPFCVLSFNITGIILQCLREGKLYKLINKNGNVFDTVNLLYTATYYTMYIKW